VAGYILKRLALAVAVTLAVSIIAFLLLRLSGDPAIAIAELMRSLRTSRTV